MAKSAFTKQLLSKDDKYFRKYIDNTTAHGIVRIFSGKSIIRRLFWLVIVLGATAGCLNNIIDRIIFFAGQPTSTTLTLTHKDNLTFPAVTVCNLNQYRRDAVDSIHPGFGDVLRSIYYSDLMNASESQQCVANVAEFVEHANLSNLTLASLSSMASSRFDQFIIACYFAGQDCNESDFIKQPTDIGICYTFNSIYREPPLQAVSTGSRAGLFLGLSIDQSQYVASSSLDAGVKIVVHPRTEIPQPEDIGVGVPPGTNAFIGIRERNIIDETQRECRRSLDTSDLNFLGDGEYPYSISSCNYNCLLTSIARNCNCVFDYTNTSKKDFEDLPDCKVTDICCILEQHRLTFDCECPAACRTTTYDVFNSYSGFPAQYVVNDLESLFNLSMSSFDFRNNFLSANIYFESLNIETQTTSDAYGAVALLSDIGGQLGLFLGVSVISIMEFATWIIDELKHRFCGDSLNEKSICRCCKKTTTSEKEGFSNSVNIEDKEMSTVEYVAEGS